MKHWMCRVCRYTHASDDPPEACPVCRSGSKHFEESDDGVTEPELRRPLSLLLPSDSALWRCQVCGLEHRGISPPAICPVCGVGPDLWDQVIESTRPRMDTDPSPVTSAAACSVCTSPLGLSPSDACPVCGARHAHLATTPGVIGAPAPTSSATPRTFLIVGSGIAAMRAAEAIRAYDARAQVTLLTREKCLPYHRMNLTRYLDGDVDAASTLLHSPSWYESHGIEVRLETDVVEIVPRDHSVRTRTRDFSYDRLVLATGARVAVPLIRQIWIHGVRPLRSLSDCARILEVAGFGRKVVVLGGGLLGIEAAVALRRRSCEVVVIERGDSLLRRQLDGAASLLLQRHLEGLGIRVLLSRRAEAIEGDEYAESVRLDSGQREAADLVVVATGIVPNTGLATGAGLRVNHGVLVDDALQTSDPDVYAAGDVAEHRGRTRGSWNAAWEMGSVAGANAAGGAETYCPTLQPRVLKIVGMDVCSLGKIVAEPGTGRELVHAEEGGAIYQKVVLDDGHVVGGVFLGDTHPVAAVREAIRDGRDVSSAWENARSLPDFLASLEAHT